MATDLTAIPGGGRVYIDTNVWIYALEGFAPYAAALGALFGRVDAGEFTALTSELTLAEALVKPLQTQDHALAQVYLDALQTGARLWVAPVARDVLVEAARLRARHAALKLPDAIHAATALKAEATAFVTNDRRFEVMAGLNVVLLSRE